jgi:ATP-dependent DNA ligase
MRALRRNTERKFSAAKSLAAMEARSVEAIPRGQEWQYEPKWDGFRCLLSRNGAKLDLRSKSGEDLARYFPELVEAALKLKATTFLLDGEIVVPHGRSFSFDDLLQRIHPAASRVGKLSQETPALYLAFDLLASAEDARLSAQPLGIRRAALEAFARSQFKANPTFRLSPATTDYATAGKWLARAGGGYDGDRQAPRPVLSIRQSRRHAEDQEFSQRRLRGRRLPLRHPQAWWPQGRRLTAARPL